MSNKLLLVALSLCTFAATATAGERVDRLRHSHERCGERAAAEPAPQSRPASIPPHFHDALARVLTVVRLPKGVKPELVGIHSHRSAFVLASGTIFVSSRLWSGEEQLDADEAAAVLAHELAHIELAHIGIGNTACGATASASRRQTAAATGGPRAILRAVQAGDDEQAVRLMRDNHLRELAADRRAAELLALAGVPPMAVGRMLVKLARADGGGYSGSHPALETRLENLGLQVVQ